MKRSAPHHPKMRLLAATLKIPVAHAVGIMEMLWHYSAHVSPRGDIGTVTDGEIAGAVAWDRKPSQLLDALVLSGWLERDEIYRFIIHDWPDHCEASVSKILERRGHDFLSSYGVSVYSEKKVGRRKLQKELVINGPTRVAEAKAMAKASVELNTSSEENTSTRARSENTEAPAEAAEVRYEWEKRFPRVKPAERGLVATRVEEIIMPVAEWQGHMDAYKSSEWAKENGYPLRGFLKDPRSWERLERKVYETPMAFEMRKSLDIAPKSPTTIPELLAAFDNPYAAEIISVYVEIGKGPETTFPVVSAFLGLFAMRTPEEQAAAAQNARMALIDRDPKWVKGLLKWWEGQPWTAANIPRQLKPPKDAAPSQEEYEAKILRGMQELEARERASNGIR